MKHKNDPLRTCVICRVRQAKRTLARFVCPAPAAAALVPDPEQLLPGRGFYLCSNDSCRTKFERYKGWRKKRQGAPHDEC
jgi:predicted RNA-binding protein YlxR (DUF448 family)